MTNPDDTATVKTEKLMKSLRTGRATVNTLLRSLRSLRCQSDETSKALDEAMLVEYRRLQAGALEMQECQDALRKMVERTMAPPWYPVPLLGLVDTNRGVLAKVVNNGTPSLVQVHEDVDIANLHPGDEVCLSEKHNLLVFKAINGQPVHGGIATVERLLGDGRLIVKEREAEFIVARSNALSAESVQVGDRLRWSETAMIAVEKVPGPDRADQFLIEEVADTPPQTLGGMDRTRDRIIGRYVMHIAHPGVAGEYGVMSSNRRLLMEGPPGCGKTLLARVISSAIRNETGRPVRLVIVSGRSVYDPYVGQTERNIVALFQVPEGFTGISIIFLDEIDAIGRARGGSGNAHSDRFLGTLLAQMEGFESHQDVVVMAATNRAEMLDPALNERFAYRLQVSRPTRRAAAEILAVHLPDSLPLRPNAGSRDTTLATMIETAVSRLYDENADNRIARLRFRDGKSQMVHARDLLSGRLLEQIALAARQRGFERHVSGGTPGVEVNDMQLAVTEAELTDVTMSRLVSW